MKKVYTYCSTTRKEAFSYSVRYIKFLSRSNKLTILRNVNLKKSYPASHESGPWGQAGRPSNVMELRVFAVRKACMAFVGVLGVCSFEIFGNGIVFLSTSCRNRVKRSGQVQASSPTQIWI